jgi:hypothetical protein
VLFIRKLELDIRVMALETALADITARLRLRICANPGRVDGWWQPISITY